MNAIEVWISPLRSQLASPATLAFREVRRRSNRPAAVPQGDWYPVVWAFGDASSQGSSRFCHRRNVEVSGLFNSFHGVRIDSGSKAGDGPKTSGPSDSTAGDVGANPDRNDSF